MTKFDKPVVFKDKIEIGTETLNVEFTPIDIADAYYKALREIMAVERKMKKAIDVETANAYAQGTIKLMCVVFGEENAEKILAFYDGNYAHMIDVVVPYMCCKIAPVMRLTSKKMRRKLKCRL